MTYEGKLNIHGERFSREKGQYMRGDDMEHTPRLGATWTCSKCHTAYEASSPCRLHAAAPALLEALETLVDFDDRFMPSPARNEYIIAARAAIEAAK